VIGLEYIILVVHVEENDMNLYDYLNENYELNPKQCDWCSANVFLGPLFDYNDETVCITCLKDTDINDLEDGHLTTAERNTDIA